LQLFGLRIGTENTKLGPVYSFSLPSLSSCPGASEWCKKHCYAKRYERIRPKCREAYQSNMDLLGDMEQFITLMSGALPRLLPCFRIHVSGDFTSVPYIKAWSSICKAYPGVKFWSYTRSWNIPEFLPALNQLRRLPNVQLFASTDPTMPLPPKGWRVAFIQNDQRSLGEKCLEQSGQAGSCMDCGYCFVEKTGNVVFKVR
jgi:hypothetical protein